MSILQYKTKLPWDIDAEVIERLRGLGAVDFHYTVHGENRNSIIRDLADELQGWHVALGDPDWWSRNLSRGVALL